MFQQLTQSAIQGRLEFDETHVDDKMAMINSDDKVMTRLHQAGSPNDKQVHTEIDETESSSEKITQVSNLEDRQSISVMTSMPSTGGQQENPKIDPGNAKNDKVSGKDKWRKSKFTIAQLLEKYQKESEEKCAYWPSSTKASRSSPRRKCKNRDWQKEKFNAEDTYSTFGTPMPMSWTPPYADSSWDRYDSWTHYPSYYRSSHQNYAAPRGSSFDQQPHAKDRFNKKESVRSSRDKKEVIKQVYRVKKDGRKCATSDSVSSNKEPVKLILATKGEEIKQLIVEDKSAKSECANLKVPKVKTELPKQEQKLQPGCPLGLSRWQERKLQRLCAEELKKKNMSWVPKESCKDKNDMQDSIANKLTEIKKGKNETNKQVSRMFISHKKNLRLAHRSYSSTMPSMPLSCSSPPGMIGYPPWVYFDPLMHYNYLHHGRISPSHYTFD